MNFLDGSARKIKPKLARAFHENSDEPDNDHNERKTISEQPLSNPVNLWLRNPIHHAERNFAAFPRQKIKNNARHHNGGKQARRKTDGKGDGKAAKRPGSKPK